MEDLDKRIAEIMNKNIISKTKLVNKDELDEIIKTHELEGWKLVSKIELNNKFKVTFQKKN